MFSAGDWALKKLLKFILKRNIGRYLDSELDLDQLDVELGTGRLELRSVLLACDAINTDLVSETSRKITLSSNHSPNVLFLFLAVLYGFRGNLGLLTVTTKSVGICPPSQLKSATNCQDNIGPHVCGHLSSLKLACLEIHYHRIHFCNVHLNLLSWKCLS